MRRAAGRTPQLAHALPLPPLPDCARDVALAASEVRATDPRLSARAESLIAWAGGDAVPEFDADNHLLGSTGSNSHSIWNLCSLAWEENRESAVRGDVSCDAEARRADPHSIQVLESWLAATDAAGEDGPNLRGPINQTAEARPIATRAWEGRKDAVRLLEAVDAQYARRAGSQVPEAAPVRPGRRLPWRRRAVPMAEAVIQRGGTGEEAPYAALPVRGLESGLTGCYNRLRALAYRYRQGLEEVLGRVQGRGRQRRALAAEGVWRQLHRVRRMRAIGATKAQLAEDAEEMLRTARRAGSRKARLKVHRDWLACRARRQVAANVCGVLKDYALRDIGPQVAAEWRRLAAARRRVARRLALDPSELAMGSERLPRHAVVNPNPDEIRAARRDLAAAERYAGDGWDSPITMRVLDAYASMKEVEYNASIVADLMRALNLPVPAPNDCYACAPGTMGPCQNKRTSRCSPKTWKNGICRLPTVECNQYGAAPPDPAISAYDPMTGQYQGSVRNLLPPARPGFVRTEDMPRTPSRKVSRRRSARRRSGRSRRVARRPGSAAAAQGPGNPARARSRKARVRSVPLQRRPRALLSRKAPSAPAQRRSAERTRRIARTSRRTRLGTESAPHAARSRIAPPKRAPTVG